MGDKNRQQEQDHAADSASRRSTAASRARNGNIIARLHSGWARASSAAGGPGPWRKLTSVVSSVGEMTPAPPVDRSAGAILLRRSLPHVQDPAPSRRGGELLRAPIAGGIEADLVLVLAVELVDRLHGPS